MAYHMEGLLKSALRPKIETADEGWTCPEGASLSERDRELNATDFETNSSGISGEQHCPRTTTRHHGSPRSSSTSETSVASSVLSFLTAASSVLGSPAGSSVLSFSTAGDLLGERQRFILAVGSGDCGSDSAPCMGLVLHGDWTSGDCGSDVVRELSDVLEGLSSAIATSLSFVWGLF